MRELVRSLSENDVGIFAGLGKGATPELHVFGWPDNETEPVNMRIGVGITDDDEVSFRGMPKYRFGGEVVVDTINNAGYDTDKILVPGRNGEISFRTEAEIFGDLGIAGTTNYVVKYTSATTMGISQIFDNGTTVGIGTVTPVSLFSVIGGLTTTGSVVTLGTNEPTVVLNDVLGRINFYAPLEASGGDANLVAASIVAIAAAEFTAAVNTTSLYFQTGNSETATTKMVILGSGFTGIGVTDPDVQLEVLYAGTQQKWSFDADSFCTLAVANGSDTTVTIGESGGIRFVPTTDQTDFFQVLDADGGMPIFNVDATNEQVGVGTATPVSLFSVIGGLTTVGSVVTLGTNEPTVELNDVLGRINFYAPLEASGGDANLVAASIVAIAAAEFTAAVNTTSLYFQTGNSETATTKMVILGSGFTGIGVTDPDVQLEILSTGVQQKWSCDADSFCTMQVTDGSDSFIVPGESGGIRFYPTTNSTDFFQILNQDGLNLIFNVDTTNRLVGIGVTDPDTALEVLYAGNQLKLSFDGTDNCTFAVDTNGDITVTPSGSHFILASTKDLRLGNAYQAGAPTVSGYVLIEDSTGTQYKVAVQAA